MTRLRPKLAALLPAVLLALALLPGGALAQERPPGDTTRATAALRPERAAPAQVDTTPQGITPRGAFLRSLVLPGWGQSAVGSPGRGAAYFALESGSLWMFYKSRQKLQEARALERTLRAGGEIPEGQSLALVEAREEQVEDWATLSIFWLLFSAADAYVSAYLADFDERVGVSPAPGGGLRIESSVPVGRRP